MAYARFGPPGGSYREGALSAARGARLAPRIAPHPIAPGLLAVGGNARDAPWQPLAPGARATPRFGICPVRGVALAALTVWPSLRNGGRSMTYSFIAPVFAFRTLAQIDSSAASSRAASGLFGLALVAIIVFVALTGFLVWRARPTAPSRSADQPRRPLVPSAWGLSRGVDPGAAAADSGPRSSHSHAHRRS